MPIYMNYTGIQGDVTATGYENWIEVNSFQWGVGRGISSPVGGSDDRESSAPSVSEIVVTKPQDAASILLLKAALEGEGVAVEIDFVKTDAKKLEKYSIYKLDNVMISGYSLSSGGDRPTESISLNFTKIDVEHTQSKAKGDAGKNMHVIYDLSTAVSG